MIRKVLSAAVAVSLATAPAFATEGNAVRAATPAGQSEEFLGGMGFTPILVFFTTLGAVILAVAIHSEKPTSP